MHKVYPTARSNVLANALAIMFAIVALLAAVPATAQWSAEPGATVRNVFGPPAGNMVSECRGACGAGCPDSCEQTVNFECMDSERLRRVVTYECGTHQGCRVHDDCLDACPKGGDEGRSCATQCDADIMDRFGFDKAGSWLMGGGPYDGEISFEYTRDGSDVLEPAYRCPDGASRQCSGNPGCTANGAWVEPVFDTYPEAGAGAMRVTAFRAGPDCGGRVCEQSAEINVTGSGTCPGGRCTRFAMEFDYANADPSAPLDCTPSTSGGEDDFVGGLLKQGADAMATRSGGTEAQVEQAGNEEDGMAALMGLFGAVMSSADSPEDVNISMAPLDEDGNPIESQRVGSTSGDGPPPIPRTIDLPAASGHLFVPMYQLADGVNSGEVKERRVRCTHRGAPVLETIFRLHTG